jgi:hypothetical protein
MTFKDAADAERFVLSVVRSITKGREGFRDPDMHAL